MTNELATGRRGFLAAATASCAAMLPFSGRREEPNYGTVIMYGLFFADWIKHPETIREKLTEYVKESRRIVGRDHFLFVCERELWNAIRSQIPLQKSGNGRREDGSPIESNPNSDSYAALEGFPRATWVIFYGPGFVTGKSKPADFWKKPNA
jgi:hypothetical protein